MNDEMTQEIDRITEKIEFFMNDNIAVHVTLKNDDFLNGIIIKKLKENVYWLEERKLGEIFLFLKDVRDVEQFREAGK